MAAFATTATTTTTAALSVSQHTLTIKFRKEIGVGLERISPKSAAHSHTHIAE